MGKLSTVDMGIPYRYMGRLFTVDVGIRLSTVDIGKLSTVFSQIYSSFEFQN